ncbi:hypothetical protein RRG08_006403 [Elysia crispata]|uniref:Uncharacterized protein n=1 Tax=Elysia crispata TaxID=231223 RepID=A0AAE0Y2U1_9GAST|nr:hypothetical protein RRG08_006403 [Elysia crispata]
MGFIRCSMPASCRVSDNGGRLVLGRAGRDATFHLFFFSTPLVPSMDPKALIDDEVYKGLKNTFLKVLVQLYYLREDGSKPWSEVEDWMLKMFPGSNLQRGRVRYLIESAHAQFLKAEDKISFLAMGVDFDFLSESLSRFGITRSTVSMPPNTVLDYVVPNKMVIDLENTRKELKLPKRITLDWVKHLTGINVTGAMMDKLLKDYCLQSSCDKAFDYFEKDVTLNTGESLGRDKDKMFSRFFDGENATNR